MVCGIGRGKELAVRTQCDLERQLVAIDGRGYPAYKSLRGVYDLGAFELSIDHVQGDPFATPSLVSVHVPAARAGFAREFYATPERCVALEDLLVRRFTAAARRVSFRVRGSGKSGLIATSSPGPEVLPRSACEVGGEGVLLRLEMGFPAHGRTLDARALATMLFDLLPVCVERALVCGDRARRRPGGCARRTCALGARGVRGGWFYIAARERGFGAPLARSRALHLARKLERRA